MTIHEKLTAIQSQLKAPKKQRNEYGKYNYRSCEDILEAVKPLLNENGLVLTISDDIVEVGARVYVKATATVHHPVEENTSISAISATAFAREQEVKLNKQGKETMDHAQITGSASSYARKYALNGLFCIDDTKDADATNDHGKAPTKAEVASSEQMNKLNALIKELGKDPSQAMKHYCGNQTYWKPEQAEKAIGELTAAKKNLSSELDSQ